MITLYQLFITIGIMVSYIVDLAAAPHWRVMFGLGAVPGVVLAVGMSFMPSSPRWLASRGRMAEAKKVLDRTLEPALAEIALREIQADLDSQKSQSHWWLAFRSRAARRALVITTTLAVFQQLIGINAIIYYAPRIFQKAGFVDETAALWATLVVGLVNVVATFITIGMVDKTGRRKLLIWGLAGMVTSLGILGIAFKQFDNSDNQKTSQQASAATTATSTVVSPPADVNSPKDLPSTPEGSETLAWLTLVCVIVYIACFAFSMGPLVWVLIGEMFPLQARCTGNAIACGGNYFANFIVGATFLSMLTAFGASNTFLLFASMAMFALLFVLFFLPETAGRTLEEIERDLGEAIPSGQHPVR